MTIYTKVDISGVTYRDTNFITVNKSMGEYNTTSSFDIQFDNTNGKYSSTFNINDEVIIYADKDVNPPTTKIFRGIIEDNNFRGKEQRERLTLTGRDTGVILLDNIVNSRIFKNVETSEIVKSLIIQNIPGQLTTNNVNVTTVTPPKITFNNITLFDALKKLSDLAEFYFYIDEDLNLHFEERDNISSGVTFDNTNVTDASFRISDHDLYNHVTVVGERQLTGAEDVIGTIGSVYSLSSKPFNTRVTISGAPNTILQPGGIINVNNPQNEDVKYLVDFDRAEIIFTSGTTAGDNIQASGTNVIFEYDRSTPLIVIKQDTTSINTYGRKDKKIIDKNIKDGDEANDEAETFLNEHKDPKTEGNVDVNDILDLTPGNTVIVDLPNHNQNSLTYSILNLKYKFNKINNYSNQVLNVKLNKKINNFIDTFKDQIVKLRILEGAEVDTSIIDVELATADYGVSGTNLLISRSIGSAFYFNVPGHDQLNSSTAVLGDARAGSIVFQNGVQI